MIKTCKVFIGTDIQIVLFSIKIILLVLTAASLGLPQEEKLTHEHEVHQQDEEVISRVFETPVDGAYRHAFELTNGINVQETGSQGPEGQYTVSGSYR